MPNDTGRARPPTVPLSMTAAWATRPYLRLQ